MERLNQYISKKVISLEQASQVGYVLNIVFDDEVKTLVGLIIIDEESENSFILYKKDIKSIGEDCVMIDSVDVLEYNISSQSNNPINKIVYDSYGNTLGKVIDVEIEGCKVKKIITDKCEFPQKFIRKSGDNYIIFGNSIKRTKKKTFIENISNKNVENLPKITITEKPSFTPPLNNPEFPIRLYADTKKLIGKTVTEDLIGYNNEIIAHKNQKISKNILNNAISHNKLNLLNFYSK